jgi:hypothetical protein
MCGFPLEAFRLRSYEFRHVVMAQAYMRCRVATRGWLRRYASSRPRRESHGIQPVGRFGVARVACPGVERVHSPQQPRKAPANCAGLSTCSTAERRKRPESLLSSAEPTGGFPPARFCVLCDSRKPIFGGWSLGTGFAPTPDAAGAPAPQGVSFISCRNGGLFGIWLRVTWRAAPSRVAGRPSSVGRPAVSRRPLPHSCLMWSDPVSHRRSRIRS